MFRTPTTLLSVATLLATTAFAQVPQQFVLPRVPGTTTGLSIPFGSVPIRFQAWYSAAEWQASVDHPMAINQIEFMTEVGGRAGRVIDLEVRMAHARSSGLLGVYQANMVDNETLVFPATAASPRDFTLPTSLAGQFAVQIPLANEFIWDGQSAVVIDIKIRDNGNNGLPYPYELAIETFGNGRLAMIYNENGDPNATGSSRSLTRGPRVRFTFRDGVTVPFGEGCPGPAFVTPVSTTSGGYPHPGNASWTHTISNASGLRSAIWMFGDSRTQWLSLALPHELVEVGAVGCDLLVKPDLTFLAITGGGGTTGTASLTTAVPPTTNLIGQSFFTQWLVLDPLAQNGVMSATGGLWHAFGP